MAASVEISDLRILPSPRDDEFTRISVEVEYGHRLMPPERAWFEIPRDMASEASGWGDSWLITFLPLAVSLGQPLHLRDLPVDAGLLANAKKLMTIWSDWYSELSPVALVAETRSRNPDVHEARTASFFSGGVDSFYTLLHSAETRSEAIEDLLLLHGFDIPINNDLAFERVMQMARRVAVRQSVDIVPIATNVRTTRFNLASWGELSFACLMAGAALQLTNRYSDAIISAGLPLDQLRPHASHPKTDPLLSSSQTAFRQYGQDKKRHEKIEYLISHPVALHNLRVCYESDRGENCCRCLKCVLVMTILEIHGVLADSAAFTGAPLELDALRRTYLSQGFNSFRNTQAFARERGREDVAEAIEESFDRTSRLDRLLQLDWIRQARARWARRTDLRRITGYLRPTLWRLGRWLNRVVP